METQETQKTADVEQKAPQTEQPVKRGRGRPKGSKNKPKVVTQ